MKFPDGNDMMYRGWVGGYENDKRLISLYNFDWKVVGQFNSRKVRLLDRNHGLLVKSLEISKDRMDVCKHGTIQKGIFNTANSCYGSEMIKVEKEKSTKKEEIKNDNTSQLGIEHAWER